MVGIKTKSHQFYRINKDGKVFKLSAENVWKQIDETFYECYSITGTKRWKLQPFFEKIKAGEFTEFWGQREGRQDIVLRCKNRKYNLSFKTLSNDNSESAKISEKIIKYTDEIVAVGWLPDVENE